MSARKKITLETSPIEMMVIMSEGNPGALTVLTKVIKKDPMNLMVLLDLDDMGMRGSQIWIGYNDHCKQDIDRFIEACRSRDAAMVETVNANFCDRRAVTGGASFN